MSNLDGTISNTEVIPTVEADIFGGHEESQFAVGLLAIGDQVIDGRVDIFNGYLRLRANVYADQTRMISPDSVVDGIERDEDDVRSIHFGIIENTDVGQRVDAAMRLIVKADETDRPLPIESFFPEAFAKAASTRAVEVSRYICRHEVSMIQKQFKWQLYEVALGYAMMHDLGPTYGVVEPKQELRLAEAGVPIRRIAEPKYVPEYRDYNLGIEIDTATLARMMQLPEPIAAREHSDRVTEWKYFNPLRQPVAATVA